VQLTYQYGLATAFSRDNVANIIEIDEINIFMAGFCQLPISGGK